MSFLISIEHLLHIIVFFLFVLFTVGTTSSVCCSSGSCRTRLFFFITFLQIVLCSTARLESLGMPISVFHGFYFRRLRVVISSLRFNHLYPALTCLWSCHVLCLLWTITPCTGLWNIPRNKQNNTHKTQSIHSTFSSLFLLLTGDNWSQYSTTRIWSCWLSCPAGSNEHSRCS